MQVEYIRLTPRVESAWFQIIESTTLSSGWFQIDSTCNPPLQRGKLAAKTLNPQLRATMIDCFNLLDADGSGSLDASELCEALKILGLRATLADCKELILDVDR